MEPTKDVKESNTNLKEISDNKLKTILNNIHHKPIIMTNIYSFVKNRPFILLHIISNDSALKSSLKNTFDNAKKNNNLSNELNKNIDDYIRFRKMNGKININYLNIKSNIFHYNKKLNLIIEKPLEDEINIKDHLYKYIIKREENFKCDIDDIITDIIDKNYESGWSKIFELYYSSYKKEKNEKELKKYVIDHFDYQHIGRNLNKIESKFFNDVITKELNLQKNIMFSQKTKELLDQMLYYDYCRSDLIISNFFDNLNFREKKIFIDIILYFYADKNFDYSDILQSYYKLYPYSTKKYRELEKNKVQLNYKDKMGEILYEKNKKQSIIYETVQSDMKFLGSLEQKRIINLIFDNLQIFDDLILYNISGSIDDLKNEENDELLDDKYLRYIETLNIRQKICLICIIDRYKHSEFINNIIYPYINELHFTLFTNTSFSKTFMFEEIPVKDIYSIFITYFLTIKNIQNIEKISFGDEFCLNKNQFLLYNDEYYQSIISYIIDQYLVNYNETKTNVLDKNGIKTIEIKLDNIDNIYERYKIIYGFNKMFPNLENKNILEISYEDIKNRNYENTNDIKNIYKIIEIHFNDKEIEEDMNTIFENIKNMILLNLPKNLENIEMIIFTDFSTNTNINGKDINLNIFDEFKNLKEIFINNRNNKIWTFSDLKYNKFDYIYLGYDKNDNLIYYRNGKNSIKSIDILDLFNLFNKKIVKLFLKNENINIILSEDKTQLKIVNLNEYNNFIDNTNYNPINNLSDFIKNQQTLKEIIINRFDFTFEEIENQNIEKLSINYDINSYELFNYNIYAFTKTNFFVSIDTNLKEKFPKLEEICLGNIKNEHILFNQLFKLDNFSKKLKTIKIITYQNYKLDQIKCKEIKKEIINKTKKSDIENKIDIENEDKNDEYENEEEEEDEYYDDLDDNIYNDEYENIFENENPIVIRGAPSKKRKVKIDEKNILLIKEKIAPYKVVEIKKYDISSYLDKNNIIYFYSEIIDKVNQYYLIHQSLLFIYPNLNKNGIYIKSLSEKGDSNIDIMEYKSTENLLILFTTNEDKIICLFAKNKNPEKKGNDFCLFLNKGEIHYHISLEDKTIRNKKILSKEKRNIDRLVNRNRHNLIDYFFDESVNLDYKYKFEKKIEIYQIIFRK